MIVEQEKGRRFMAAVLVLLLLTALSGIVQATGSSQPIQQKERYLPVVGSRDKLLNLLKDSQQDYPVYNLGALRTQSMVLEDQSSSSASNAATVPASKGSSEYSDTNLQVEGVDEADIVKTDGNFIYQINQGNLLIIKATPADHMQLASNTQFTDQNFSPQEMYLDDNILVVIGQSSRPVPIPLSSPQVKICPPVHYGTVETKALVFDITNRSQVKQIRQLELSGNYLSSRKIGSIVYLVANSYINYSTLQNYEADILPSFRDSSAGDEYQTVDYGKIFYFPDCIYPGYIMVAGFSIDTGSKKADVNTYLGNGNNIYCSASNLYIAMTRLEQHMDPMVKSNSIISTSANNTVIYKFALVDGQTRCTTAGEVPGAIINQFSMDEYQGYFRIATTSGDAWRSDQNTSQNNIFILDDDMQVKGKLNSIAPGEKIYSTRFVGERAYMVTFKTVDPLFVIDLHDVEKPVILGKLKIPGYSNYLQPYDETHLIGFGKDTVESKDQSGQSQAYYQGIKLALFDVSDVNNPVQTSQDIIGDRGTDSELLYNHKALLFSRELNLLAFPVTVMQVDAQSNTPNNTGVAAYGTFSFQGAYVYHIDLQNGLQFKGRISHLSSEDYLKAGDNGFNWQKNISRILYINDMLYTISSAIVKSSSVNTLQDIGSINLPALSN